MAETETTALVPWFIAIIPLLLSGIIAFVLGMYIFKAKSETRAKLRDESLDRELKHLHEDISKLETNKVDKESIESLKQGIEKLEDKKADREIVLMMQKKMESMDKKVDSIQRDISEILQRLPQKK